MSKVQLPMTTEVSVLVDQWKEAKKNEAGWNARRKEIEEELNKCCDDFNSLLGNIAETSLTTSGTLGDIVVIAGYDLKIDQAQAVEFLSTYPLMTGVMFKVEYKPVVKAVLSAMYKKNELGDAVKKIVSLPRKNTSFRMK